MALVLEGNSRGTKQITLGRTQEEIPKRTTVGITEGSSVQILESIPERFF